MLIDYLYSLGAMLLYFPPMIIWASEGILRRFDKLLYTSCLLVTVVLTVMMAGLLPQAAPVFGFYLGLFWILMVIVDRLNGLKSDAVSLAVYGCFAVSVLWEWPIQIAVPQNPDALLMSLFKAIGIPLFFLKLRGMGFKPSPKLILGIAVAILTGVFLTFSIETYGINSFFWQAHMYRLSWISVLVLAIYETYIKTKPEVDVTKAGECNVRN